MAVGKFYFYWGKRGMVLKGKGILGSGLHPYAYAPNKSLMAYVKTEPKFLGYNPLQGGEESLNKPRKIRGRKGKGFRG